MKKLGKREQTNFKVSRRKKISDMRQEVNKKDNRKTIQKSANFKIVYSPGWVAQLIGVLPLTPKG